MKYTTLVFVVALFGLGTAQAGEVSLRFNNALTSSGLFDFSLSSEGKMLQVGYVALPLSGRYAENFFIAGGMGRYFQKDFDSHSYWTLEGSPGAQVQSGRVRVRLSQGVAYFNLPGSHLQFATHLEISLVDLGNGLSVGLERTHYSTGVSGADHGGYNMTGFTVGISL